MILKEAVVFAFVIGRTFHPAASLRERSISPKESRSSLRRGDFMFIHP